MRWLRFHRRHVWPRLLWSLGLSAFRLIGHGVVATELALAYVVIPDSEDFGVLLLQSWIAHYETVKSKISIRASVFSSAIVQGRRALRDYTCDKNNQLDAPWRRRYGVSMAESVVDLLHEVGSRMAAADPLHQVLELILALVNSALECDSCFIYVLENHELVLRASKTPHLEVVDRLKLRIGQGITGWTAQHHKPVALSSNAYQDPRFKFFSELPEDRYEALLSVPILCRGRVVGVINLQHRKPHLHTSEEVKLISTIGFLVGAEIEMARLEGQISQLAERLESRTLIERAKGILQRELGLAEEAAYRTLQRQSRELRKPMKELAEAIVIAEEVTRSRQRAEPQQKNLPVPRQSKIS